MTLQDGHIELRARAWQPRHRRLDDADAFELGT